MSAVILGGLTSSTLLNLMVLPTLFARRRPLATTSRLPPTCASVGQPIFAL